MYRLFRRTKKTYVPDEEEIRESRISAVNMIQKLGKQNSIINIRMSDVSPAVTQSIYYDPDEPRDAGLADEDAELAAAIAEIEEDAGTQDTADLSDQQLFDSDPEFESKFDASEMRCLALVAHNHMKPAMKEFVLTHQNILKKFILTGTGTTMKMLREVFGDEHMEKYGGPVCKSGPLGGDAELVALMCTEQLGALFFFQDPMDAHPHVADIECLNRQSNVNNIMTATNPTSAHALTFVLRDALIKGESSMIPSMFFTCESPSVDEYKKRQQEVLKSLTTTTTTAERK